MNDSQIKEFFEILKYSELEPVRYSGRSMFGRQCVGVQCSDPLSAIVSIMSTAKNMASDDLFEAIVQALYESRQDNMGRNMILYWPYLDWIEESDET